MRLSAISPQAVAMTSVAALLPVMTPELSVREKFVWVAGALVSGVVGQWWGRRAMFAWGARRSEAEHAKLAEHEYVEIMARKQFIRTALATGFVAISLGLTHTVHDWMPAAERAVSSAMHNVMPAPH